MKKVNLTLIKLIILIISLSFSGIAGAKNITVGTSGNYKNIQDAINASSNGDSILINPGVYFDQSLTINKNISLIGVNGKPLFNQKNGIGNGKAYMIIQGNVTIENIEFANASISTKNGAGIYYESGKLTIKSSIFRDNQSGIVGGNSKDGEITILGSSFLRNGSGDGFSNAIDIGAVKKLTIIDSNFSGTKAGSHVKSRSAEIIMTNNIIDDTDKGNSNYSINLPEGGNIDISGNTMTKSNLSKSPIFINYAEDKGDFSGKGTIKGNIFNSNMTKETIGIKNYSKTKLKVETNTFNKVKTMINGLNESSGNIASDKLKVSSIVLNISADIYKGNPKIDVIVNGKTLSGGINISSNYSSGAWQSINLTSLELPKTLEIGVSNTFLSNSGIRNIHIKSLSIDGVNIPLNKAEYKLPKNIEIEKDGTIGAIKNFNIYFPTLK